MTYINEILILANQFANIGKKPSVALIKSKLNAQVPLPIIINVLKNWTHDPHFISQTKIDTEVKITKPDTETKLLKSIEKDMSKMRSELDELKKQVKMLSRTKV